MTCKMAEAQHHWLHSPPLPCEFVTVDLVHPAVQSCLGGPKGSSLCITATVIFQPQHESKAQIKGSQSYTTWLGHGCKPTESTHIDSTPQTNWQTTYNQLANNIQLNAHALLCNKQHARNIATPYASVTAYVYAAL